MSIVRDNLMIEPGYTPYCGAAECDQRWPRTEFDGNQFKCRCGWRSTFEREFIESYQEKWRHSTQPINYTDETGREKRRFAVPS